MADAPRGFDDASLEQALADLGRSMPYPATPDLTGAVLEGIADGPPPGQGPSGWLSSLQGPLGLALLAVVALSGVLGISLAGRRSPAEVTTRQKFVVYGVDLEETERREVTQLLEDAEPANADTVSREELMSTLLAADLPVAASDGAISSTAVTCLQQGEGLHVRTHHITRIPAVAYVSVLLTAGLGDGSVIIAAPSSNPVTGETALVGVLKAIPQCGPAKRISPERTRLAYQQLAATAALAGAGEDLTKASTVMLKAVQTMITGQAIDQQAIGAALDAAVAAEQLSISSVQRSELISLLLKLRELDYGAYAGGYHIQPLAPNEVKIVPASSAGTSTRERGRGPGLVGERSVSAASTAPGNKISPGAGTQGTTALQMRA